MNHEVEKSDERILSPFLAKGTHQENGAEVHLRPQNFLEYVGQLNIVKNIEMMVVSSQKRQTAMDHVLLSGPPGLGKTSLAMVIAKELGAELHVISGPALEKKGDLAALLTNLGPRDVLFIDEIHRIPIAVEEILYSAMEDFRLDIVLGQGPSARTMKIDLAPFTLIGATTKSGMLSGPLRDRFLAHLHFDFYSTQDLSKIIIANKNKLSISMDTKAVECIARCSRGTPRIANRILRRVRDYGLVNDSSILTENDVLKTLDVLEIDYSGLDRMDRKILLVILEYYNGGPVGIDALSATLAEDKDTIEDVYEPYLLKEGFLVRTPRGRECTEKAKEHIKKY